MPGTSYFKHFTNVGSFYFHTDPVRWIYDYPIIQRRKLRHKR